MGGFAFTQEYAPNQLFIKENNAITTWFLLGMDGAAYTAISGPGSPAASNVNPWPYTSLSAGLQGLDPGMWFSQLTMSCDNGSDGAGSTFYFAVNLTAQPMTDFKGQLVTSNAIVTLKGQRVYNLWFRKTVATDRVELYGNY